MSEYKRTLLEYVKSQDDMEFSLGDTLDVKASIAIVIIIFLATQSVCFLHSGIPLYSYLKYIQVGSVLLLVAAGVLAVVELVPRDYGARMSPASFLEWIAELEDYYGKGGEAEPKILDYIGGCETAKIKSRFAKNSAINSRKSFLLQWCFRCLLLALLLNLVTVFGVYVG